MFLYQLQLYEYIKSIFVLLKIFISLPGADLAVLARRRCTGGAPRSVEALRARGVERATQLGTASSRKAVPSQVMTAAPEEKRFGKPAAFDKGAHEQRMASL